jgi:large subunit ribosomal protein L25
MTETITLSAEMRQRIGKGGAREARRQGRLPAVIYGPDMAPLSITLDAKDVALKAKSPGFHSHVYEVAVAGAKHQVLAREWQEDPVSGELLHLDLMRFSARTTMTIDLEITVINEEICPGVKKGGLVNVALRSVQVACLADNIPDTVIVDIAGLEIGDTVHAKDLELPQGVELGAVDPEATVVNIAAPKGGAAEEEGGEATTGEAS